MVLEGYLIGSNYAPDYTLITLIVSILRLDWDTFQWKSTKSRSFFVFSDSFSVVV